MRNQRVRQLLIGMALASGTAIAGAAGSPALSVSPVESVLLMPIEGAIAIDSQGHVTELRIDTDVPANLRTGVERVLHQWQFEPELVDGVAQPARADMRLVLAARQVGKDYEARIDNVSFREPKGSTKEPPTRITGDVLTPPRYPESAMRANVDAQVLFAVRVDTAGNVVEAATLQSGVFDVHGKSGALKDVLRDLEAATMKVAAHWRFHVASRAGAQATAQDLTVVVPLVFYTGSGTPKTEGRWRAIARSPRRAAPWLPADPHGRSPGVADVGVPAVVPLASTLQLLTDTHDTVL